MYLLPMTETPLAWYFLQLFSLLLRLRLRSHKPCLVPNPVIVSLAISGAGDEASKYKMCEETSQNRALSRRSENIRETQKGLWDVLGQSIGRSGVFSDDANRI